MPVVHGDVADCPCRSSPEWAAQKEFALLALVAERGSSKTKKLYLQKQRIFAFNLQSTGGQPSQRRAATDAAAQQNAGRQAAPTACQLARRERSQKQLRLKHLASKLCASIRVASRLRAWRARACATAGTHPEYGPHPKPAAPALPVPQPAIAAFRWHSVSLAAFAPPGQHSPTQLLAAARASLDETELQDIRGSKRDASARTPPPKSNPTVMFKT